MTNSVAMDILQLKSYQDEWDPEKKQQQKKLGGGFKYCGPTAGLVRLDKEVVSHIFNVHPYLGKIPILTNIFQLGWKHQPHNQRDDLKKKGMDSEPGRIRKGRNGKIWCIFSIKKVFS